MSSDQDSSGHSVEASSTPLAARAVPSATAAHILDLVTEYVNACEDYTEEATAPRGDDRDRGEELSNAREVAWSVLEAAVLAASATEKDAERYRWLRESNDGFNWMVCKRGPLGLTRIGDPGNHYLDAAIDAAIAAAKERP